MYRGQIKWGVDNSKVLRYKPKSMLEASALQELSTLRDFLRYGISQFSQHGLYFGHGTDSAFDETWALLAYSLHLSPEMDEALLDARLLSSEKVEIIALFEKRITQRLPVPYITQTAYFSGLPFYVDERVLIPRSPMAEIIQKDFKPYYIGESPSRILDLCTGSGCIGIAAAMQVPDAEIVLADIDRNALDVARVNVERFNLMHQISLCQGDLLSAVEGKFDIILANPPYVDSEDMADMPEEFGHEPEHALASGEDGLFHPLQILKQAADYLTEQGVLFLEVGNSAYHLMQQFPDSEFNWVELAHGGQGILAISQLELGQFNHLLST